MLNRSVDLVISLIGGLILLIISPLIALLIKIDSRGPVFFKCDRVGQHCKIFKMYKFRTMYQTDVPLGQSISPRLDPRVTRVGRVLRRLKLNEFPQFINILKGDMTLIGPRPESPDLVTAYPPEAQPIFSVKPGLIGPNQIYGRNEEEFYPAGVNPKEYYITSILPNKLPLDLKYIQEKSFLKDIGYLFMGIWVTVTKAISRRHILDNLSQISMLAVDAVCCIVSFALAHLIRFDGFPPGPMTLAFLKILPFTVLVRLPILFYLGCYQTLIRYLALRDLKLVFYGVTLSSAVLFSIFHLFEIGMLTYSRQVFVTDWLLLAVLLIGYRGLLKGIKLKYKKGENKSLIPQRVLIWGAGQEGRWCARYLQEFREVLYEINGFIDKNPEMRNRVVDGHKVLGNYQDLEILFQLYKIQVLFIADPNIPPSELEFVQKLCEEHSIYVSCFVPRCITNITLEHKSSPATIETGPGKRAIILAGGKGVRLAPLTKVIPKPLVPIGDMPILEVVIRQLKNQGFEQITLAVGYLSGLIKAYFQDGSRFGVRIDYSSESEPLGTAGPLALIDNLKDTFLVMNADVLTNIDYNELISYHLTHQAAATIGAYERQVKIDLGVIVKNGGPKVIDYVEKPTTTHLVSMGIYVFEPRVLPYLKDKGYLDFPDLVKLLISKELPVIFYPFSGYWLDIGRHDDYAQAVNEFENMRHKFLGNASPDKSIKIYSSQKG
jgi:lipopolysaccharide/colanic/teichoic acid biosynthesis glycosyltransferase/dTDP-glucose pyrophosphorylase